MEARPKRRQGVVDLSADDALPTRDLVATTTPLSAPPAVRLPRGLGRVLFSAADIDRRVREIGGRISAEYRGRDLVLVGVLRGALCFMTDLMRTLDVPTVVEVMAVSSYSGRGGSGVKIVKDVDTDVAGRHVIVVEDIVDTGMTLDFLLKYLSFKRPASLEVCALLDKKARRTVPVPIRWVGFEIPDEFVVGYGLDYRDRYRNLPYVATLSTSELP